jgi:XTP/dITP diphosphohydrolase
LYKKKELAAIFREYSLKLPGEAGITGFDPQETGDSFLENALIKARALYELTGEPALADDSGLCVDALGGRPGIYSSRYGGGGYTPGASAGEPGARGGENPGDGERNALLLAELGDTVHRRARFVCAMVLLLGQDRFYAVQETLEGEILRETRGAAGFGYDPVFYLPERGCTVAELPEEEKNLLSHRGRAGRALAKLLGEASPPAACR